MRLSVSDLSLSRGGRRLVQGLTFGVDGGRALMLRGPNGVGKTSLLRALAGLARLDGGTVRHGDVRLEDRDAWSEVAVLGGHADAIKAQLSVLENLAFWARIYGGDPGPAIATFDLAPLGDRLAGACSAGQRRRLGLARLILSGRPLWLLDEPTVSLDRASVAALSGAITAHLRSGGSAVIASHETDVVADAETLVLEPLRGGAAAGGADDPFLAGEMC